MSTRTSKWSLALLPLTLLSIATSALPTQPTLRHEPQQPPVCIIGAGPAGLSAARRLEDKNIKAVIFDKEAEVGGKCQAWYDEK